MDVIIGAGITGLTYASFTSNPYLVLEADNHTGGLCNTIFQDGFIWDYSGHFFHFRNPEMAAFMTERIGRDNIREVVKHTQIKYKGRLIDFPFQMNVHQLERSEYLDCLHDLASSEGCDEGKTFKSMLYARFGKSIADKFLIPYNEKLYATDLDNLDRDAMGRFFPPFDKETVLRGTTERGNHFYNSSFNYPHKGAIQYVRALERDIPKDAISLNERVLSVNLAEHRLTTNRRTVEYTHLISTIPLVQFLNLCDLEYNRSGFSWNKVLVFNLGFDKPSIDSVNHWIYFPEAEYCFYRVGFYSNIIPSDRMSLYVEIGLDPKADVNVDKMLERVLSDLSKAGIVTQHKLQSWHHVMMNPAYVHITSQGSKEVTRVKEELASHDVYSIGRYGSWNYSSIEDNMLEAIQTAQTLNKHV